MVDEVGLFNLLIWCYSRIVIVGFTLLLTSLIVSLNMSLSDLHASDPHPFHVVHGGEVFSYLVLSASTLHPSEWVLGRGHRRSMY